MKIRFFSSEKGNELFMWHSREWSHVPRVDDLLHHNNTVYEIIEVRWENPDQVGIWVEVPESIVL